MDFCPPVTRLGKNLEIQGKTCTMGQGGNFLGKEDRPRLGEFIKKGVPTDMGGGLLTCLQSNGLVVFCANLSTGGKRIF